MQFRCEQFLVSCEHASNRLPERYGTLKLEPGILASHIAWDIGAAQAARALARTLGCPHYEGAYSRLLVDLNRSEESRDLIVAHSHGYDIPGNQAIDGAERAQRIELYHRPYHADIDRAVEQIVETHSTCIHLSMHSFTNSLDGNSERNADVGLLYHPSREEESRCAAVLRETLQPTGLRVRMNYPYRGTMDGLQTRIKKVLPAPRYVGLEIELNQGLFEDPDTAARTQDLIGAAVLSHLA